MADTVVHVRASRQRVLDYLRSLPSVLSGKTADSDGLTRGPALAFTHAVLTDLRKDYLLKAHGGAGEDGVTWPALSPITVAMRKQERPAADVLTAQQSTRERRGAQQQNRQRVYNREKKRLEKLGLAENLAAQQAKRKAQYARLPRLTGNVPILIDTGRLLAANSPGMLGGTGLTVTYQPVVSSVSEAGDQRVDVMPGTITIVCAVPYGYFHQEGHGVSERAFQPKNGLPQKWMDAATDAFAENLAAGLATVFARMT